MTMENSRYVCPLNDCGWGISVDNEDIDKNGLPTCPEHKIPMVKKESRYKEKEK